MILGAFLSFLALCHLDLLFSVGEKAEIPYNPETSLQIEFPNPFPGNGLILETRDDSPGLRFGFHGIASLLVGIFLFRLVGVWTAALAGAALYGVHPLHVAVLTSGVNPLVVAAQPAFFAAGVLLWTRIPALGGVVLAAVVILDPSGLMLPVFFALVVWLAPGLGLPRSSLVWAGAGVLAGLLLSAATGLRAWPCLPMGDLFPAGPPLETPIQGGLLILGRAMGSLFFPVFRGHGPGGSEGAFPWSWADPGAFWVLGVSLAFVVALGLALIRRRGSTHGSHLGCAAAALGACLVLPVPGLVVGLRAGEGFHTGGLYSATFLPGLLLALGMTRLLASRILPAWARTLAAAGISLVVLGVASYWTFTACSRLKTGEGVQGPVPAAAGQSYLIRLRRAEWLLRHDHNKLDIKKRLEALAAEVPEDPRPWAALGRFNWIVRRYPEAVKSFEKALALDASSRALRFYLAGAYLMARKPDKTLEVLRFLPREVPEVKAVDLLASARAGAPLPWTDAPGDPPVVARARGRILTQAGRYAEALAVLDRARIARPEDALLAAYRGWCLLELGRTEEGVEVLTYEALVDVSGFLAHKLLGDLYLAEGPHHDRGEAYFHYANFVKHDRGHPDTPRILKILQAMQKGLR